MTKHIKDFLKDLQAMQNPGKAANCQSFFQCGKGGYGEGDKFWGLTVPQQREVGKKHFKTLEISDFSFLLKHEIHEVRLSTLMMMVLRYQKTTDPVLREQLVDVYLASLHHINNWDLVDASAPNLLGDFLLGKDWKILEKLAKTDHLWTQRVAIISTHAFIRKGIFEPTLTLADILLQHPHDLIHKAVGWMLRELGNMDYDAEFSYLKKNYKTMPRTMLRYAIEKFSEPVRQALLKGSI